MSKLIFIIKKDDVSFQRVDTFEKVDEGDFKILNYTPVLFMKPEGTPPQEGVYAHYFSKDFNEICDRIPDEINAVLLSKRHITIEGTEIYAGQYCYL